MRQFLRNARGSLHLAEVYAGVAPEEDGGDHPFAAPPNPTPADWCVCGRCADMATVRENVCCGQREYFTTQEYFRATALDHNVLQLQIRLHADYRADVPNFHANGYRKAAYRQYTLSQYGYLGRGIRRVAPSCVVRCVRNWFPSPDGVYMGYRSD